MELVKKAEVNTASATVAEADTRNRIALSGPNVVEKDGKEEE